MWRRTISVAQRHRRTLLSRFDAGPFTALRKPPRPPPFSRSVQRRIVRLQMRTEHNWAFTLRSLSLSLANTSQTLVNVKSMTRSAQMIQWT
ncbi:hypothetical protein AAFF_G00055800 [Aldrovandia affinis]|uniref:Uncharacterized protein n=1 Tax=Aldrovandia affinis TaxID=143900 RepID=A0AAD7WE77_9TELE|nr:hypothetical protein AAFF_G00055800 [Aldrovandia affinis]